MLTNCLGCELLCLNVPFVTQKGAHHPLITTSASDNRVFTRKFGTWKQLKIANKVHEKLTKKSASKLAQTSIQPKVLWNVNGSQQQSSERSCPKFAWLSLVKCTPLFSSETRECEFASVVCAYQSFRQLSFLFLFLALHTEVLFQELSPQHRSKQSQIWRQHSDKANV